MNQESPRLVYFIVPQLPGDQLARFNAFFRGIYRTFPDEGNASRVGRTRTHRWRTIEAQIAIIHTYVHWIFWKLKTDLVMDKSIADEM